MRAPNRSPAHRRPTDRRWPREIVGGTLLFWLCLVLAHGQVFGVQRTVRTRIANYEGAPVLIRAATTQLVQTYSSPGQFPFATVGDDEVKVPRSRVRYLNKVNQQIQTYLLEGEVTMENQTAQPIEALQLTTIILNAFRERIATERQSIAEPLPPHRTRQMRWSRNLSHQDVFELYVVVTRARFGNGTVWTATEELILVP